MPKKKATAISKINARNFSAKSQPPADSGLEARKRAPVHGDPNKY
jgi:hypothetical protein